MTAPTETASRYKSVSYFLRFCKMLGIDPKLNTSLKQFKL